MTSANQKNNESNMIPIIIDDDDETELNSILSATESNTIIGDNAAESNTILPVTQSNAIPIQFQPTKYCNVVNCDQRVTHGEVLCVQCHQSYFCLDHLFSNYFFVELNHSQLSFY